MIDMLIKWIAKKIQQFRKTQPIVKVERELDPMEEALIRSGKAYHYNTNQITNATILPTKQQIEFERLRRELMYDEVKSKSASQEATDPIDTGSYARDLVKQKEIKDEFDKLLSNSNLLSKIKN